MLQNANQIRSLQEARKEFSTVHKCQQYLKKLRWPDGVTCPRCETDRPAYIKTRKRWQCRKCRYQFSVTAGTIFHRSKIDLPRWFVAIWLMCHSPKGISAKQLERELGVHYETAWYMAKRIRKAMKHDIFERKLCGIVEVDDAMVKSDGNKRWGGKTPVVDMASRDGGLRLEAVERIKAASIEHIVAKNIDYVKCLYTDGGLAYKGLEQLAPLKYVVHIKTWVDGDVHTNFIENAWSLFKRGLVGMYHHVSSKHLQEYLDEFAFRYSHRNEKGKLFDLVLSSC